MKTKLVILTFFLLFHHLGGEGLCAFDTRERFTSAEWETALQDLRSEDTKRTLLVLLRFPELAQLPQPFKAKLDTQLNDVIRKYHNHPVESNLARLAILWLPELGKEAEGSSVILSGLINDETTTESTQLAALGVALRISKGSSNYFAVIKSAVTNKNVHVQEVAYGQLPSKPSPEEEKEFIPFLVGLLGAPASPNEIREVNTNDVRVITGLGTMGSKSALAVTAVRQQLVSHSPANRSAAINALYKMNAVSDKDVLLLGNSLKETEHFEVRRAAIRVLSLIDDKSYTVIKEIEAAAESRDPIVASKAAEIMRRWIAK